MRFLNTGKKPPKKQAVLFFVEEENKIKRFYVRNVLCFYRTVRVGEEVVLLDRPLQPRRVLGLRVKRGSRKKRLLNESTEEDGSEGILSEHPKA